MKRYAIINIREWDNAEVVARYLPENYELWMYTDDKAYIRGEDDKGWTLDDYVLPRLASGLYFGEEVDPAWTMPESTVYHVRDDCPALRRSNRYYPPRFQTVEQARARSRRPCKLCKGEDE